MQEESTRTVLAALREVIEHHGLCCSIYSDRASHFWVTTGAGQRVESDRLTQVGRALQQTRLIPAYSPQARGRMERNYRTWQGRLPQELRSAPIRTLSHASAISLARAHGQAGPPVFGFGSGFQKGAEGSFVSV